MKSNKLTYLLVGALAITMAATGCKKKPVNVTQLPGQRVGSPRDEQPAPGEGGKIKDGEEVKFGGGPTADPRDFEGMIMDRPALAAHTVHFDYDSATVKSGEKSNVAAVAAALKSNSADKLLIEGHCDERGTEEYNRSLGERRALALREALAKQGVDPDRIRTLSFGEDKPVAMGHDESAWKQNRRGEFVVLHPK
ncbi:MAG: OmpA family protein [Verrucomicrobia bacterium]|jgi:peptidoglycan-associated lipoprotein|nr:OmpA family protein [Verrucomicrobiota bacterium]